MKIRRSPTAISDLDSIRDYIARDSPSPARKVANRIKESINRLVNFPQSGRAEQCRERANWSSLEPRA
jgi:plasmid stabilization system protein ParE